MNDIPGVCVTFTAGTGYQDGTIHSDIITGIQIYWYSNTSEKISNAIFSINYNARASGALRERNAS